MQFRPSCKTHTKCCLVIRGVEAVTSCWLANVTCEKYVVSCFQLYVVQLKLLDCLLLLSYIISVAVSLRGK